MMLGISHHWTIWNLPHLLFTRLSLFSRTLLGAMARSSASGIWKFISDSFLELGSSTLALALISDSGSGFCLGGPAWASSQGRRAVSTSLPPAWKRKAVDPALSPACDVNEMLFSLSRSHLFFPFLSLKSSHSFLLCGWNGIGVYLTSVSSFLCALNKSNLLESSRLCPWIAFTRYLSYHVFKIPGMNDFEMFTLPTNHIPYYAFSNVMYVLTTWNLTESTMLEEVRGGPEYSISSMFWDGARAPSWEAMLSVA